MSKRRARNEGSVFQRKDGRWVAQVTQVDSSGAVKQIARYFSTQAEARKALTRMKSRQDAHRVVISGRGTVREWLDIWLETFVKPNRSLRTFRSYHDLLKLHLPDKIGSIPLAQLAPEIVQHLLNAVASKGLGRSAELLRAVLRSSFNRAVKLGRMECNPVTGTDPITYEKREGETFTIEEARKFLVAAEDDRLGALFTIALSLGLRKGEVCGLRPEDINFDARVIHVRRSLGWIKVPGEERGRWVETPPKRGSVRDLRMTETIFRMLVRHQARRDQNAFEAGEKWKDSGFIFVSTTGAPLHERNVSEAFYRLCDRAAVPRIRFHDTRHSCGTLLYAQGADPFVIAKVLGHSQLSTTRRYTHVPTQVTGAAIEGLEKLIGESPHEMPVTVNPTVNVAGKPS